MSADDLRAPRISLCCPTMNKSLRILFRPRGLMCCVAFVALSGAMIRVLPAAEKPARAAAQSSLAHELQGTWVHVGEPGKVGEPPAKGGFIKLRTAHHWAAINVDPRSGLVTSTHGGTWRINGDHYEETVAYGSEYHAPLINKAWTWKLVLKDDVMTKTGINNEWHEVWKRVK